MTEKNAASKKVDSRFLTTTPKFERAADSQTPQAAGFADDFLKKLRFVGCQGVGEGIYLGDNEQAHAADSRKSAAKQAKRCERSEAGFFRKPTPKPSKRRILGF